MAKVSLPGLIPPLTVLLCLGCEVSKPARLEFSPVVPVRAESLQPRPQQSSLVLLAPLEDKRPDPESLGQVYGRSYNSGEIVTWVEGGLREMVAQHFAAPPGQAGARITLRPRILKAYLNSVTVSRIAVLVLECDFVGPDGGSTTQVFRGQLQGLVWAAGEDEAKGALLRCRDQCLDQIQGELSKRLAVKPAS